MWDFLKELVKFIDSPYVKENSLELIVLAIIIIALAVFATSIVFNKLIIPLKLKKSENIMPEYEKLLKENKVLREEVNRLKCTKAMLNAAREDDTEKEKPEDWEKQFLVKSSTKNKG